MMKITNYCNRKFGNGDTSDNKWEKDCSRDIVGDTTTTFKIYVSYHTVLQ